MKNEMCRMEVKVWLSGKDPATEQEFLEHSLAHLISGGMTESPLVRYSLTEDCVSHIEYPKDTNKHELFDEA